MTIINNRKRPAGLYIHIPFCLKKCGYCDFLSFGDCDKAFQGKYVDALTEELAMYGDAQKQIDTIFIGGGTPSLLGGDHIEKIQKAVEAAFCVIKGAEVSMEANPKTLTMDKLLAYRQAGVNRLSIGAQSMDNGLLAFMGRAHDRADFLENYRAARAAGFENINVDLMFGIPGQTRQMWQDTLAQIIDLAPEHISFYSLQLEEGTPFCAMYRRGQMDLPSTEEDRWMYHYGIETLNRAGYSQYEISNCAKPGYACRHNLKYWSFDEYYSAGLGAHSFSYEKGRQCNTSDLDAYFDKIGAGLLPVEEDAYEEEDAEDLMGEYVFTALRRTEGLDTEDFFQVFGRDFFQVYTEQLAALEEYEKQGFVKFKKTGIALTEKGFDSSNEIMAEFV